ncbi:MAG: hypothetical protein ACR2IK_13260 [Chloroflexota bacterium]
MLPGRPTRMLLIASDEQGQPVIPQRFHAALQVARNRQRVTRAQSDAAVLPADLDRAGDGQQDAGSMVSNRWQEAAHRLHAEAVRPAQGRDRGCVECDW